MKRDSGKTDKRSDTGDPPGGSASAAPSAQAAFASYAAPLVGHAVQFASAVREDASPEALHKLRVSLRRLRSLWWAFAPLLEKDENIRQRALFKYLATAAGKTRDWDILIELLSQEDSGARDITPRLREARGSALAVSRETLSNADVKHLLREALAGASKELNTAHERMPLRKFATRRVDAAQRALKKRMKRANRARRSDYTAFHDVRKAGKKLRYLLDFFEPVLKGSCKSTARRVKRIQKRFGALNDVVASEGLLREHAASLAGSGDAGASLDWLGKERKRRMRAAAALLRKR
ncbi:metal-binding protein [Burkholderia sp. SG-MS1]|uniref:CHAD domain-containing protein n=1 Tax=Paraburkholderia sp. SG-MS1 TaxID=2023741 RepID=UPI00144562F2|nr:CHAD domain-containing protein [Paraburkholderia sp. SG-MS1]NKJ46291.1 metal-binding protein [Paraburkholderia sp. SG-MS1]